MVLVALLASVACGADDGREATRTTAPPPTAEVVATATALAVTAPTEGPAEPRTERPIGVSATVAGAASATSTATRVSPPPPTVCEQIAAAIAGRHDAPTLQVIVRSESWDHTTAVLEVATRVGSRWTCGPQMEARLGRTGTTPLLERRSGDGSTPAGVFPLATMTAPDGQRFSFFGNSPDPGVTAGAYRRVQPGDCFGATPNTAGYGHLRFDTRCPGPDDEYLPRFVNAYTNAALIGANMEPDVSGDAPGEVPYAAAIFLHRHSYVSGAAGPTKPTAGCVSLSQPDLTSVLLSLTPDAVFAIGPTDWLLTEA